MKKYEWSFSFFNLFEASCAETVKLQQMAKGVIVGFGTPSFLSGHADAAMIVALSGMILDTLIGCLHFEKKDGNTNL